MLATCNKISKQLLFMPPCVEGVVQRLRIHHISDMKVNKSINHILISTI